jgi:hypothetical protein
MDAFELYRVSQFSSFGSKARAIYIPSYDIEQVPRDLLKANAIARRRNRIGCIIWEYAGRAFCHFGHSRASPPRCDTAKRKPL